MSRQIKGCAVGYGFKRNKLTGGSVMLLEDLLREYDICAVQLKLSEEQRFLFFLNFLKGSASERILRKSRSNMTYRETVRRICRFSISKAKQYNTIVHMLKLHITTHMYEYGVINNKKSIRSICELTEQYDKVFCRGPASEKHKAQFLCQTAWPYAREQLSISKPAELRFTLFGFQCAPENFLTQLMLQIM